MSMPEALAGARTLAEAVSRLDARVLPGGSRSAGPVASEAITGSRFVRFTIADTSYAIGEAFVTELDRVPRITPCDASAIPPINAKGVRLSSRARTACASCPARLDGMAAS